ncbi:hypothetical protein RSSM_05649 [Rhodopirellula sallentina SM41]|uniref:Uncharacterized protein n=1 Tax=Rhodopirellula sallentina SM41 TaxID=1263870 RepID=M5TUQ2_9BACT|nr:hypothetical protein RSSM_05649 [Rhodopirellula sallentina SM41]
MSGLSRRDVVLGCDQGRRRADDGDYAGVRSKTPEHLRGSGVV